MIIANPFFLLYSYILSLAQKRKSSRIKIWFIQINCLLFCANVQAQNLVPNPSFENLNSCTYGAIDYSPNYTSFPSIADWVNPIYQSTPDPLSICGNTVPDNLFGHQQAHTGEVYVGMYAPQYFEYTVFSMLLTINYREYIECKLLQPMVAGHQYYVSFYVSLAELPGFNYSDLIATDDMGIYFSTAQVNDSIEYGSTSTYSCLSFQPQIKNTSGNFLSDTVNWTKIQGVYTASGGEEWLTLGLFGDTTLPDHIIVQPRTVPSTDLLMLSYMYVDDLCVLDMNDPLTDSRDTFICPAFLPAKLSAPHPEGSKFQWSNGDTTSITQVNDSGVYWVRTWGECIYYVDTISVGFNATQPIGTIRDTVVCDQFFPIKLEGNSEYTHFRWNTGDTTRQTNISNVGKYWVSSWDQNCVQHIDTIQINADPFLKLDIGIDSAYCYETTLSSNHDYQSYLWNTRHTSPSLLVTRSGQYILNVNDACGTQADTVNISIQHCDCIWVPNAFTPNGDGNNDQFKVQITCPIRYYTISIYNRFGQRVFVNYNHNISWNGTFRGQPADMGTYYYVIRMTAAFTTAQETILKGDLTLLR